jgi:uncharacterized paraquat-inducible protein A
VRRALRAWLAERFGSGTTPTRSAVADEDTDDPARLYVCACCEKTLVARRLESCPACGGVLDRTQTGQDLGYVSVGD